MKRPSLHFTADRGWINDPHGITFRDGEYHLFHQYVPDSLVWAPNCHWGHATSANLLTWDRRGIAIAPGDGDDGIWTGSLVTAGPSAGDARILYTSVTEPGLGMGRVRVATPKDDSWDEWEKGQTVMDPPDDLALVAYRDPFVIREADGWRAFVGAATPEGDALALTYTSADLEHWIYEGVSVARSTHEVEPVWMGALWECPQLFQVESNWVMVSSVWDDDVLHYAGYGIGDRASYQHGRFEPTDWGRLSYGGSYYAPSFFQDRDGRPCLMFWMRGVADPEEGWASCLSVPYELRVTDGRLAPVLHPEVLAARGTPLDAGTPADAFLIEWCPGRSGDRLELLADGAAKSAQLSVSDGSVTLDRPGADTWTMPWHGEALTLVVDGPVVEVVSTQGILGGAVDPVRTWQDAGGTCTAWALRS